MVTQQTTATSQTNPAQPLDQPADQSAQRLAQVPVIDDVVDYAIQCALALAPDFASAIARHAAARAASKQVSAVFGGETHYVGKKQSEGNFARNAQIRREYRAGAHLNLLARRYGLKKTRISQIVNE